MAVKASVTITLSIYRDTDSVTRYYLLQSSTLSKPSKPTTYPPTGDWDDTEPGYTSGSTNSLYFVDCTVFSDGTFQYSEVSLSSSYEAAKEAYNLANATSEALDNLSIGGRNYLPNTRTMDGWTKSSNVTLAEDDGGYTVATWAATSAAAYNSIYNTPISFSLVRGQTVTLSFDVRSDDYANINTASGNEIIISFRLCPADSTSATLYRDISLRGTTISDEWMRLAYTATLTDDFFAVGSGNIDDTTRIRICIYDRSVYSMQVRKVKLEIGNVATDWTPAHEDMETAIEEVVTIVNGKTTSYYAGTVPSGTDYTTGDIWFDTANDNAMYYWNGSAWTLAPLGTDAIADGAITANLIAASAVTAGKISSGAVTTDKLTANAVTAAKIAAGTITATQIAAGTITGDNIAASTITAGNLVAGTITSNEIAAGTITASNIASGTITADLIKTGTITGDLIAAKTITGDNLVAGTITATQIAAATITGDNIAASTIKAGNLNVTKLSAISGDVGTLTAGILKSQNYDADGGTGLLIDLDNGTITGADLTLLATKIDNISVGGRNYLLNTRDLAAIAGQTSWSTGFVRTEDEDGFGVLTITGDGAYRTANLFTAAGASADAWDGQALIFSADIKSDDLATTPSHYRLGFAVYGSNDGKSWTRTAYFSRPFSSTAWEFNSADYANDTWMRLTCKLTGLAASAMTADSTAAFSSYVYAVQIYSSNTNSSGTISIRKPKLEFGTVATDWTPAPEDTDDQIEAKLALTVDGGVAKLSANADRIELSGGEIVITSDNFSLAADGTIVATNGTFTGKITATSGTIGGFTIGSGAIYNSKTSLSSTGSGVYVGTDGISLGSTFSVTSAGTLTARNGTIGPLTITNTSDTSASGHRYTNSVMVQKYGITEKVWDAGEDEETPSLTATVDMEFGIKAAGSGGEFVQYLALKDSTLTWADALRLYSVNGRGLLRCSGIQIYPTYSIQSNDGELSLIDDENMCAYTDDGYLNFNLVKFTENAVHSDFDPAWSGEFDMGGSGYYWRRIYCDTIYSNHTGSTSSDRKLKQNITALDDKYDNFLMGLTPVSFEYKDGDSHRKHLGFIAQDVRDLAMDTVGDLALFKAQVIGDDRATYQDGKYTDEQLKWGLSYEEFVPLAIKMLQDDRKRIEHLESALEAIKTTKIQ